jgi:uncharacterized protein YyaL (SSP411 family)
MNDHAEGAMRPQNRLAHEKSPYLLQHRHNPVDWYPWGDEAFERARREEKPVFLSIGYSTCHWCHVMERECFEDGKIAALLNAHFVCVKVDREERPDVDRIYMTFLQATTRGGGWPLNVFLTPDRKPFFAGTYWPPAPRHGRASFPQVLGQIIDTWRQGRTEVMASAEHIHHELARLTTRVDDGAPPLGVETLETAIRALKEDYDEANGGWGGAPKFPLPSHPSLLLQVGVRASDADAVRMVIRTCARMADGGIHDQLGGGFARYATDAQWRVPHFEKMLYDNAQLLELYLDAHLVTGERREAEVARGILRYVLRDMTDPDGGFYSAEDADSEGREGRFYCWTRAELEALLTPDEFATVTRVYGITEQGNFRDHSDPDPLPGQNVLVVRQSPTAADVRPLESAKAKLLAARAQRVRPHRDDKILASWNGLMLAATARAGIVLDDDSALAAARANFEFLRTRLWDEATGTLHHRWREGERDATELLDSHAYLLHGVVALYEVTLEPGYLDFAVRLAERMIDRFHDPLLGGFWQSAPEADDLIFRLKDDNDGAEPSGNSMACRGLLRLAAITARDDFEAAVAKTLRLYTGQMMHVPRAMTSLWQAAAFHLAPVSRVVIAGDPAAGATRALLDAAHGVFHPYRVVLGTAGAVDAFARSLPPVDGRPTAYLCTGTACQAPTHDAATLRTMLMRNAKEPLVG